MHHKSVRSIAPATLAALLALLSACAAWGGQRGEYSAVDPGYPVRPIRMLLGLPAGGSADTIARLVANKLGEAVGQPIVTDNRVGAFGRIAPHIAATATPDGYTLLFRASFLSELTAALNGERQYELVRDFAPISLVAKLPNVLLVHPVLPVWTVADLIAHAKQNPGKLNYGSSGVGSSGHLSMELLKKQTGIDLLHVPYRGAPQFNAALLSSEIQAAFANIPAAISILGKVRALAVTGAQRSPQLADVPTMREAGVAQFEITVWFGMLAPARVREPVLARLNAELVNVLNGSDVRDRLMQQGAEPAPSTRQQFVLFQEAEVARWSGLLRETGLTIR